MNNMTGIKNYNKADLDYNNKMSIEELIILTIVAIMMIIIGYYYECLNDK